MAFNSLICLAGLAAGLAAGTAQADLTISAAATENMSCSGGVCAPTAAKAVLNVADLENLLAAGNVEVTTTGSGVEAKDIEVAAALSWPGASSLALAAYESLTIDKPVSVSGSGGLSLATNNRGSGGALTFGPKGNVQFAGLGNALTINGTAFTLVNSVSSLASAIAENPSGAYALASDYDASADGQYIHSPVLTALTGTVEGLGNSILHLSLAAREIHGTVALFAEIEPSAVVDGLRLVDEHVYVRRGKANAAGLVVQNLGTVSDDEVEGVFVGKKGDCGLGGLVVGNLGTVNSSSVKARFSACDYIGGLTGYNSSLIEASSATGSIIETKVAGGLTDNNGGLILNSYADVAINTNAAAGGLVGYEDSGGVQNSYAMGSISGGDGSTVGGLVGYAQNGGFESSYSTGAVSGGANSSVGGFAGREDDAYFSDCYWDTTTSGTNDGVGGRNVTGLTGLTTQQLQSRLPKGFKKKVWTEKSALNDGFPYLLANPPPRK